MFSSSMASIAFDTLDRQFHVRKHPIEACFIQRNRASVSFYRPIDVIVAVEKFFPAMRRRIRGFYHVWRCALQNICYPSVI
jgi:hypothetical protein